MQAELAWTGVFFPRPTRHSATRGEHGKHYHGIISGGWLLTGKSTLCSVTGSPGIFPESMGGHLTCRCSFDFLLDRQLWHVPRFSGLSSCRILNIPRKVQTRISTSTLAENPSKQGLALAPIRPILVYLQLSKTLIGWLVVLPGADQR